MQETPRLISCKSLKTEYEPYQQININSREFTIGRGPDNTLVLPFSGVQINHCKLIKNDEHWILEDYSKFGIQINGMKLGKGNRQQLYDDDVITLDSSKEFVYKFVNADAVLMSPPAKRVQLEYKFENADAVLMPPPAKRLKLESKAIYMQRPDEGSIKKQKGNKQAKDKTNAIFGQTAQQAINISKNSDADREIELSLRSAERDQSLKRKRDEQSDEVISKQKKNDCVERENKQSKKVKRLQTPLDNTEASTSKILTEFGNLMENELECNICKELFMCATTLKCSHTFCQYCIATWRKRTNSCPICRACITSACKSLVLDSLVNKIVEKLPQDIKQKRADMIQIRSEEMRRMRARTTGQRGNSRSTARWPRRN